MGLRRRTGSASSSDLGEDLVLCPAFSRAALPSRSEVVGFRLQASYFLATAPKSNQKTPPRDGGALSSQKQKRDERVPSAPQPERGPQTGHPWPVCGRFGILPRPARTHARAECRSVFAVLGAANGGRKVKSEPPTSEPLRGSDYFDMGFALLLLAPPGVGYAKRFRPEQLSPVTAPSTASSWRHSAGACVRAGRGRMPKRPTSGHGWPVGGPRHERGAQGTPLALVLLREGRSSREAALFGYFLALLPKSNSPVGENPRLHYGKADAKPDSLAGVWHQILRTTEGSPFRDAQDDSKSWIPAFAGVTSHRKQP